MSKFEVGDMIYMESYVGYKRVSQVSKITEISNNYSDKKYCHCVMFTFDKAEYVNRGSFFEDSATYNNSRKIGNNLKVFKILFEDNIDEI